MIYGFTMLSPAPADIFNLENRDLISPSSDLGMGYASEISAPSAPMPFMGEQQSGKRRTSRAILVDPKKIDKLPEDAVRPFRVPTR